MNVETHVETLRKGPCAQGVSRDKEMVEDYLPPVDFKRKSRGRFNGHSGNGAGMLKQPHATETGDFKSLTYPIETNGLGVHPKHDLTANRPRT